MLGACTVATWGERGRDFWTVAKVSTERNVGPRFGTGLDDDGRHAPFPIAGRRLVDRSATA
jgi:hypothetical protein